MDLGTIDNLIAVEIKRGLVRDCIKTFAIRCDGTIEDYLGEGIKLRGVTKMRLIEEQVNSATGKEKGEEKKKKII